jgi:hypothetical protein
MSFVEGHALVIGVGSYRYMSERDVPITVADAEAVARALRDPQLCGYPTQQVELLTERATTKKNILAALDRLASQLTENDTLFLFYAGHGYYDESKAYCLTTHDTRMSGKQVVRQSAVRQDELLKRLEALKARRVVLIFNACHSGALAGSLGDDEDSGETVPENLTTAMLGTGQGRVVITACRASQKAYYARRDPLTIFADKLIAGLNGTGVVNRGGLITILDLYMMLYQYVSQEVHEKYDLDQEPALTVLAQIGLMPVALYRGSAAVGSLGDEEAPDLAQVKGAVRVVSTDEAQRRYQEAITISGSAISQSGPALSFGSGNQFGDLSFGDIAGGNIYRNTYGDSINVGDISGSGIAIGRGASANINSGPPQRNTYFDSSNQMITLKQALEEVQRAEQQASQAGLSQVARDLGRIAEDLQFAQDSAGNQNAPLRARLLQRAQRDIKDLVDQHSRLKPLYDMLMQVQVG